MAVQLQAIVAQPNLAQPAVHDFQRRHLVADEQHLLSVSDVIRDQVGDGLALARAGRPDQHEALAARRRLQAKPLAAVGVEHMEGSTRILAVKLLLAWGLGLRPRDGQPGERLHQRMRLDALGIFLQVLEDDPLGKREQRQHHLGLNLPPREPGDRGSDLLQIRCRTRLVPVGRRVRQAKIKVLPQPGGKGRIHERILITDRVQDERIAQSAPAQLDRQQEQRRAGRLVIAVAPLQNANRQVKDVQPAFVKVCQCAPIKVRQDVEQPFTLGLGRDQLTGLGTSRFLRFHVPLRRQKEVARLAIAHKVIKDIAEPRLDDREVSAAGRFEGEQRIAPREVDEVTAPTIQGGFERRERCGH